TQKLAAEADTCIDRSAAEAEIQQYTDGQPLNVAEALAARQDEIEQEAAKAAGRMEQERAAEEVAKLKQQAAAAQEAARKQQEAAAAEEAARLQQEQAAQEAARKQHEAAAAKEATRLQQEASAAKEAARVQQERAAQEAARLQQEEATQQAARLQQEHAAAEEAARVRQERAAQEATRFRLEQAAQEAARKQQEAAAAEEAARLQQQAAAAEEAARLQQQAAAAEEAARVQQEQAAQKAANAHTQKAGTPQHEALLRQIAELREKRATLETAKAVLDNLEAEDAQDPWQVTPRNLFPSPPQNPSANPTMPTACKSQAKAAAPPPPAKAQAKMPQPKQMPAAAAAGQIRQPPPSQAALNKRLSRAMEPNAKGVYKVSEEIRRQWNTGGDDRKNVIKLFAEANYDTETFVRRHSTTAENSKEMELAVDFEFLSKAEMAAAVVAAAETNKDKFIRATKKVSIKEENEGLANTDHIEVDVDLEDALMVMADGLSAQPPQNDELAKLLKKLGFPEGSDLKRRMQALQKAKARLLKSRIKFILGFGN
ncbi:unnamed protein product, partial [Symbiodinium sp. CCMP2592]